MQQRRAAERAAAERSLGRRAPRRELELERDAVRGAWKIIRRRVCCTSGSSNSLPTNTVPHHGTEQDDHRSRGFQRRAAQMELRYQPHAPGRQGGDAEPERRGGDYLRGAQVYAAAAAAAHGDTPGASIVPGAGGMASAVALQQAAQR